MLSCDLFLICVLHGPMDDFSVSLILILLKCSLNRYSYIFASLTNVTFLTILILYDIIDASFIIILYFIICVPYEVF